jgi:hypothetical protein
MNETTKSRLKRLAEPKKEEPKQIDLDNIQVYTEPPEITEVRKKKEEEWKKKDEDAKKKIFNERVRQDETAEYIKKQKDFEKKNVTADSNGIPIFIKGITYGLLSDFIVTRHVIAEKEQQLQLNVKTEKSELKEVLNLNSKKEEKPNVTNISTVNNKETTVIKRDEKRKPGETKTIKGIGAEMRENVKGSGTGIGNFEPSKPLPVAQPAGSNYE